MPDAGEEEALSVPPPLSPPPVAAEEEAATALPESNQKLPTLKDVSDDLKEEDKADVFTPSSTETSEADDTVDEDENATEDDEEEELCEISKLKVNIMVLKNKLKTLENQISCSQDDNQGNQSTSDLHDQFNELSANYSRFKEECREELDSLLTRVNQHDNILDTLSPKDQKIEELKAQLESAENKREENKKMILTLIDEIKGGKLTVNGNSFTSGNIQLKELNDKILTLESKINDYTDFDDSSDGNTLGKLNTLSSRIDNIEQSLATSSANSNIDTRVSELEVKLNDFSRTFEEPPPPPPPSLADDSESLALSQRVSILESKLSEKSNQFDDSNISLSKTEDNSLDNNFRNKELGSNEISDVSTTPENPIINIDNDNKTFIEWVNYYNSLSDPSDRLKILSSQTFTKLYSELT